MDIHKPKPWHGLREFLKEYVIIVVGVLTALGAEQLVETLHWNHRVGETRVQLNQELGADAGAGLRWLTNAPCLDAQLTALSQAVAEARHTGTYRAPAQRYAPTLVQFTNDAWLNARSLQVSDHMGPEAVKLYSKAFFYPAELATNITTLHSLAGELEPLDTDLDHVSPAEAGEWAARIGRIRELQARTEVAMTYTILSTDLVHEPIGLEMPQRFAADRRKLEGACVADPVTVLATLRDRSLSTRQQFEKLGLVYSREP
ncbi:hypothetical protein [Phenylobacterium sp.]|uniref:hypothetical protein n=1 Tax=Phenylobacterium sp. TaxID=1871053 RepID=UPI0011F98E36|nr:hypothetical protein [Phenylobacterium sp.]THD65260.1 MAG: hypothetical protein E8A12_07320 [Phenylobacterium sp.]